MKSFKKKNIYVSCWPGKVFLFEKIIYNSLPERITFLFWKQLVLFESMFVHDKIWNKEWRAITLKVGSPKTDYSQLNYYSNSTC